MHLGELIQKYGKLVESEKLGESIDVNEKDSLRVRINNQLVVPNTKINIEGDYNPLRMAIVYELTDLIDELLEMNADVNIPGDFDGSCLHAAAYFSDDDDFSSITCKKLLEKGAYVNREDDEGQTPLDHSLGLRDIDKNVSISKPKTWKVLLEHGALANPKAFQRLPNDLQEIAKQNEKLNEIYTEGDKENEEGVIIEESDSQKVTSLLFHYTHPLRFFKFSTKASCFFSGEWGHHDYNIERAGKMIKKLKIDPLDGKALREYLVKERKEAFTNNEANPDGKFISSVNFMIGNIR